MKVFKTTYNNNDSNKYNKDTVKKTAIAFGNKILKKLPRKEKFFPRK